MIGTTTMTISKEQMMVIVEYYLNQHLFATTFHEEHSAKVVDQIRKTGDRFVITFEGQKPKATISCDGLPSRELGPLRARHLKNENLKKTT